MAINWKEATSHDDYETWEIIDQCFHIKLVDVGADGFIVESANGRRQAFAPEAWAAAQACYINKVGGADRG